MSYDPGALDAALAAAVGDDPVLIVDLRHAFLESAQRQIALLERARCDANRSEEHTSELQSLMRISYAVFCLKKNTTTIPHQQLHVHSDEHHAIYSLKLAHHITEHSYK